MPRIIHLRWDLRYGNGSTVRDVMRCRPRFIFVWEAVNMSTMALKEKPDLLFNNPLKQKVYVFLKTNPGKDVETFQVLTGDSAVSRQHFKEVEQAILAREEREKSKAATREVSVAREVGALFLNGSPS